METVVHCVPCLYEDCCRLYICHIVSSAWRYFCLSDTKWRTGVGVGGFGAGGSEHTHFTCSVLVLFHYFFFVFLFPNTKVGTGGKASLFRARGGEDTGFHWFSAVFAVFTQGGTYKHNYTLYIKTYVMLTNVTTLKQNCFNNCLNNSFIWIVSHS